MHGANTIQSLGSYGRSAPNIFITVRARVTVVVAMVLLDGVMCDALVFLVHATSYLCVVNLAVKSCARSLFLVVEN